MSADSKPNVDNRMLKKRFCDYIRTEGGGRIKHCGRNNMPGSYVMRLLKPAALRLSWRQKRIAISCRVKADAGLKPNADLSLGVAVQSKTAVEATA
jgi:hypothetical protein